MARFAVLGYTGYIFSGAKAEGIWDDVEGVFSQLAWLGPLNLLVGYGDSIMANITVGEFSSTKKIEPLFSASKWAAGALFYNLDAEGVLPLDTKVSDHLPFWTTSSDDARSQVTVRHLMDFTSGFTSDEVSCWLDPAVTHYACAEILFNKGFDEQTFGTSVYKENHFQIAAAVALKATGESSFGELWYQRIGQPAGLPPGTYWAHPSEEHPAPGTGMSITSDEYAKFMIAWHKSLVPEAATQPFKLAPGFADDFFYGNRSGVKDPSAGGATTGEGGGYAYTSWRWANGLVESNSCIGYFPAIMPGTDGFWFSLAKDGGSMFCTGEKGTHAVIGDLVGYVALKVGEFTSDPNAQRLDIVLDNLVCEKKGAAKYLCDCKDFEYSLGLKEFDGESCLEKACMHGTLSEATCAAPSAYFWVSVDFWNDYYTHCVTPMNAICTGDGDGAGQDGQGSCVRIPKEVAQKWGARPCPH